MHSVSSRKSFIECFLLALDDFLDVLLTRANFGEHVAHGVAENVDELVEERFAKTEAPAVADRSAQNAAQVSLPARP